MKEIMLGRAVLAGLAVVSSLGVVSCLDEPGKGPTQWQVTMDMDIRMKAQVQVDGEGTKPTISVRVPAVRVKYSIGV